jgi:integrase
MSKKRKKKRPPKRVLALPDLEQSKAAVLNSLTSKSGQRTYDRAITDFVDWYCSEPRLAFNRTVVLRYRIFLEQKQYAATTINLRLAAVRRVAFEAADSGLLSPELAAGIRRVKGVRRIGVRIGNWLTAEQGKRLLAGADRNSLRGKRDYAMLATLIGCGLRRGELLGLRVDAIGVREEHWVIADLNGEGRTHAYGADPSMGEGSNRRVEGSQRHQGGCDLSLDQQGRPGLGEWNDGEGAVAGCSRCRRQSRHSETCSA